MHSDDVGMTLKEVSRHLMTVPRAKVRFAGRAGGHRETYVPTSELDGALSGSREVFEVLSSLGRFRVLSTLGTRGGKAPKPAVEGFVSCRHLSLESPRQDTSDHDGGSPPLERRHLQCQGQADGCGVQGSHDIIKDLFF